MNEPQRHVLIWVAPEFLNSSGMIRVFTEAGIVFPQDADLEEYIHSAVAAGGFAMTGTLAEAHHGAGIWISPVGVPALELMVPWQFVRSVITAETPQPPRAFGLTTDLAVKNGIGRKQNEDRRIRNSTE